MAKNRGSSGAGRLLLGFVLGVLATTGAGFAYLHFGKMRIAAVSKPLLFDERAKGLASHVQRGVPKENAFAKTLTPPFGASEDAFEGGAHVYRAECARCHGLPGRDAAFAKTMHPAAGQLWKRNEKGGIGVNGESAGDIYGKVANGIRPAMPAYKHVLTQTQMWQVSLLLADASKELPGPVMKILTVPQNLGSGI